MPLSDADIEFLTANHSAAMVTVGADGRPKVARIAVALVDGRLWSSGTRDRVRTARLRRDPRCTLYVHDDQFSFLGLETDVTMLEGPDVPEQTIRMFRLMRGQPTGPLSWFGAEYEDEPFRQVLVDEGRLLYQFEVQRSYGIH